MEEVFIPGDKPVRLVEWLVKLDDWIKYGAPLAIYRQIEEPSKGIKTKEMHLKSKNVGRVKRLLLQIGQVAKPGCPLLELESCSHEVTMKDMCAECGQDLRLLAEKQGKKSAHVSMVPNIPELKISAQQAEEIAKQDVERLHKMKKLVLLVDLDQTLIHTTQNALFASLCKPDDKNFYTFHLHKNEPTLYTKLRPHCRDFIDIISKLYELQIVTFGSRQYAHKIADFIDPEKKYFANRILSRDECINPMKKSGNLRHLFPCGDSMVCIIDDRDDVWNQIPNLVLVKKYSYFPGAGDINSPDKAEQAKSKSGKKEKKNGSLSKDELPNKVSPRKRKSEEDDASDEVISPKVQKTSNKCEEENKEQCKDKLSDELAESVDSQSASTPENTSANTQVISHEEDENKNSEESADPSNEKSDSSEDLTENTKSDTNSAENCTKIVEEQQNNHKNHTDNVQDEESMKENKVTDDEEENVKKLSDGVGKCKAKCAAPTGGDALEDTDDYLLYLQNILTMIHETYFEAYNKHKVGEFEHPPDLRGVVPFLRSKVLYGCHLVFTGIIPNNFKGLPHQHKAHVIAKQLGATVETKVSDKTTHLVGGKKGTAKYQECIKMGKDKIKFVAVDWLWVCSERWERVNERLFPIPKGSGSNASSREGTPPITQGTKSTKTESSGPKTYNALTGKLVKKVKDPRFDFMVTEAVNRNIEHKRVTPLYSSLIDPNVAIPLVSNVEETKESPSSSSLLSVDQSEDQPTSSKAASRTRKPSMVEVMGIGYSLSSNDIEDMDKEVDDLMNDEDEDSLGTMIDLPSSSSSSEASRSSRLSPSQQTQETIEEGSEKSSSSSEEEFDHMAELLDHEMHYDEDNFDDNLDTLD